MQLAQLVRKPGAITPTEANSYCTAKRFFLCREDVEIVYCKRDGRIGTRDDRSDRRHDGYRYTPLPNPDDVELSDRGTVTVITEHGEYDQYEITPTEQPGEYRLEPTDPSTTDGHAPVRCEIIEQTWHVTTRENTDAIPAGLFNRSECPAAQSTDELYTTRHKS